MQRQKEDILRLRDEGKTYDEIKEITGASKGTISYHCGEGQKQKSKDRNIKNKKLQHPYVKKLDNFNQSKKNKPFLTKKTHTNLLLIQCKIKKFHFNRKTKEYEQISFKTEDIIAKFGENPKCYLTGELIDIYKPRTYQFDHIHPVSKGGDNSLDNLGICTRDANMAKGNIMLEDFYELCEKVLKVRDSKK